MKRPTVNPVLARELTERMRTHRSVIVLTAYLLLLGGILKLVVDVIGRSSSVTRCVGPRCFTEANLLAVGAAGRPVLHVILFVTLVMVCFIVPALTAGAVTGERERQTLVPLQVTLLSPRSILTGKLTASLAFVALILVATLPVASASFWVGGADLGDALRGVGMILATAVTLGSLGLLCSTYVRRTQAAVVAAYGLMIVLTLGTLAVYSLQFVLSAGRPERTPAIEPLIMNPFVATADVLGGEPGAFEPVGSPFTPMQSLLRFQREARFVQDERAFMVQVPGPAPMRIPARRAPPPSGRSIPFWVQSLASYAVITAGSLWLASRRLRAPAERLT